MPVASPNWQRTLWAMVCIQFIMTASISFLSPIIPLMLPQLGVDTIEGVYCDALRSLVEERTGLRLTLGTMGRAA